MRSKAFCLNSPFKFKFKLATHFTAFCYSNLDSEDLLQHVTAVILVFIVKDHSGIWVCLIKILQARTVSVFSFTVVLCAYREFSLCVFIHLYKFYSILTYKFLCHRGILMLHYSVLFFIFNIVIMDFVILLTCQIRFLHLAIWCMTLLREFLINLNYFFLQLFC